MYHSVCEFLGGEEVSQLEIGGFFIFLGAEVLPFYCLTEMVMEKIEDSIFVDKAVS
jgi:hypothetical protein